MRPFSSMQYRGSKKDFFSFYSRALISNRKCPVFVTGDVCGRAADTTYTVQKGEWGVHCDGAPTHPCMAVQNQVLTTTPHQHWGIQRKVRWQPTWQLHPCRPKPPSAVLLLRRTNPHQNAPGCTSAGYLSRPTSLMPLENNPPQLLSVQIWIA